MKITEFMQQYWQSIAAQDARALRAYFDDNARVRWHCTNEQFTVDEFIRANCEYPNTWQGEIERLESVGNTVVTVTRIWTEGMSFHACSFFTLHDGKIAAIDEYWGDDGPPPQWRQEMHIGTPIKSNPSDHTEKKPAPSRPPL